MLAGVTNAILFVSSMIVISETSGKTTSCKQPALAQPTCVEPASAQRSPAQTASAQSVSAQPVSVKKVQEDTSCTPPLMSLAIAAQAVIAIAHFILFQSYGNSEHHNIPNVFGLWSIVSSWLDVLLAGVMVLRNRGVDWAERLYGETLRAKQKGRWTDMEGGVAGSDTSAV